MRSHVTSISDCLSDSSFSFNTASGMRSHVTRKCRLAVGARSSFNTASGMRSHVTCGRRVSTYNDSSRFNTASGMRSHVTLCLGGRRNRRLKSWFWKTSSKPNVCSHFFSCHYIPREYVMTPPSLIQQGLRRFEENRKTYPVFSPLGGFPIFTVPCFFIFVKHLQEGQSQDADD